MTVYYVWADDYDYDDFDSFVVVAENEDEAMAMVKDKFEKWQGEIHVEKVDLTAKGIVLGSFNAG